MTICLRLAIVAAVVVMSGTPVSATAQRGDAGGQPAPAVFQAVIDCTVIADTRARLECYDNTVKMLEQARKQRELIVYDKDAMRTARKGIFGLSVPGLRIFKGDEKEEITEIDSTISAVRQSRDGMPIFVLSDGAMWRQTEGRNVFAKVGQPIHVRRAALGSYMANVNKQPGVRVVRIVN